jgi:hypothetical protein
MDDRSDPAPGMDCHGGLKGTPFTAAQAAYKMIYGSLLYSEQ